MHIEIENDDYIAIEVVRKGVQKSFAAVSSKFLCMIRFEKICDDIKKLTKSPSAFIRTETKDAPTDPYNFYAVYIGSTLKDSKIITESYFTSSDKPKMKAAKLTAKYMGEIAHGSPKKHPEQNKDALIMPNNYE